MILFTLEGFSTAGLSCYGSSWNPTPHLDRMAAGGTLWDRAIVSRVDPVAQMRRWLDDPTFPADAITLVTDDARLSSLAEADRLDEVVFVETSADGAASQIEETGLARLMAVAATRLDDCEILWLHSRFLTHAWDAPRELFAIEEMDESMWDDDEAIDDSLDPPRPSDDLAPPPLFDSTEPPRLDLTGHEHPDLVMSWMRTYGCQIRLVDAMVGILRSMVCDEPSQGSLMPILVCGTSGFALGQNGSIGHRAGPLRSNQLRVPVLTSVPGEGADGAGLRQRKVTSLDEIPGLVAQLRRIDQAPPISPEQFASALDPAAGVITMDDNEPVAISTDFWFFEASDQALFLKPDDVEDVNDVARLEPGVAQELAQRLTVRNLPAVAGLQ